MHQHQTKQRGFFLPPPPGRSNPPGPSFHHSSEGQTGKPGSHRPCSSDHQRRRDEIPSRRPLIPLETPPDCIGRKVHSSQRDEHTAGSDRAQRTTSWEYRSGTPGHLLPTPLHPRSSTLLQVPRVRAHTGTLHESSEVRNMQPGTRHQRVSLKVQKKGGHNIEMPQLPTTSSRLEQEMPGSKNTSSNVHSTPGSVGGTTHRRPAGNLRVGEPETGPENCHTSTSSNTIASSPGSRLPKSTRNIRTSLHSSRPSPDENSEHTEEEGAKEDGRPRHHTQCLGTERPLHGISDNTGSAPQPRHPEGNTGPSHRRPHCDNTADPRNNTDPPADGGDPERGRGTDGEGNPSNTSERGNGNTEDRGLRLLQWNIQGARGKLHLLHEEAKRGNTDIFLLQETLTPVNKAIKLRGYTSYHLPHTRGGSQGISILVRNSIPNSQVTEPIDCGEGVDVLAVTILLHHTSLTIYNVYNPPAGRLNLGELFAAAAHQPIYASGDFNSHHPLLQSRSATNQGGRHIGTLLPMHPEISLLNNGEATHIRGGVLDLSLISTQLKTIASFKIHSYLASDHFATVTCLNLATLPPPAPRPTRWNTRKAKWDLFSNILADNIQATEHQNLETHTTQVTAAFQMAAEAAIPRKTTPNKRYKDYWFRDERVEEINRRINAARKCWRRNQTEDNRNILTDVLRHAKELKKEVREEKWTEWCRTIDAHTSLAVMWNNIRRIQGRPTSSTPTHPNPEEEAERLADGFARRTAVINLPIMTQNSLDNLRPDRNDSITRASLEDAQTDIPLTITELRASLRTGADTSPGEDGITHTMINKAGHAGHTALLKLFNASWEEKRLPLEWKKANIIPIPKPKEPGSFRPISLLSCISKTMERMVLNRLKWACGELHPSVFAYRKGSGTSECLATFLSHVGGNRSIAVFIDLEKAFELADATVILSLLVNKGVKGRLLQWTKDFLTNREARVLFQGRKSTYHHHQQGTPQGSVLSPFLFNILVEALLELPLSQGSHLLTYADDLALVANSGDRAQRDLTLLYNRCRELGLKLNVGKTKAMAFAQDTPTYHLQAGGNNIGWVPCYQYLGVWIDNKHTFKRQITYLRERMDTRLAILRCMGGHRGGASYKVRRLYYTHGVRSLLDHCAPCLTALPDTLMARLEAKQNIALRTILGAPPWTKAVNMRAETGLPALKHRILQRSACLMAKMASSPKPYDAPVKVIAAAGRDGNLFIRRTWTQATGTALNTLNIQGQISTKGKDLQHPLFIKPPPWTSPLPHITGSWLENSKKNNITQKLRQETLEKIRPLIERHENTIYTDGSVDPATRRAGAAFTCREHATSLRVSDGASSLQTELVAILSALLYCREQNLRSILLLTDSLASLHTLKDTDPTDNIRLVTEIFHVAETLQTAGAEVTLHWIPSHIGIRGNEKADRAAMEGAKKDTIDVQIPTSLSAIHRNIKHKIKDKIKEEHEEEVRAGSASAAWYATTTKYLPPDIPRHTPSHTRKHLHRLRLGYPTLQQIKPELPREPCSYCDETSATPLLHYLLDCPATTDLRTGGPYPQAEHPLAASTAARLIASTADNTLLHLVSSHPPPR